MDPTLLSVLKIVAYIAFFTYVVAPILILFTQKMAAHPQFQRFSPDQLPPAVIPFFQNSLQSMLAHGFTVIDYLLAPGMSASVTPCLVYLVNFQTGDAANITCIWVNANGISTPKTQYAEFSTRFANEHAVTSNNSKTVGAFKPLDGRHLFYHADVYDVGQLYALHQAAMEKFEPGQQKILAPAGQEIPNFIARITESYENQVKTGLLRYDAASDSFKPTLYGAFYMTYLQIFPFKQIKASQMRAASQEIKNELARRAEQPAMR